MFEIVIFKRMQYDSCANYGFKPIEDRILNGAWNSYSEWCVQKEPQKQKNDHSNKKPTFRI